MISLNSFQVTIQIDQAAADYFDNLGLLPDDPFIKKIQDVFVAGDSWSIDINDERVIAMIFSMCYVAESWSKAIHLISEGLALRDEFARRKAYSEMIGTPDPEKLVGLYNEWKAANDRLYAIVAQHSEMTVVAEKDTLSPSNDPIAQQKDIIDETKNRVITRLLAEDEQDILARLLAEDKRNRQAAPNGE